MTAIEQRAAPTPVRWLVALAGALAVAAVAACDKPSTDGDGLVVLVSIPPQAAFVETIAGERARVVTLVPRGYDPHVFEPRPSVLREALRARLYLALGVEDFERPLISTVTETAPDIEVVLVAADLVSTGGLDTGANDGDGHHRDADGEHDGDGDGNHRDADRDHDAHSHAGTDADPHVWLSPRVVVILAERIADALTRVDPAGAKHYEAGRATLVERARALDQELARRFAAAESAEHGARSFLVYHAAFGHFAAAYGLEQIAIERDGRAPGLASVQAAIDRARSLGVNVVIVQPEFSREQAELIASEIDGRVVAISPMAHDWADNLRRLADAILGDDTAAPEAPAGG